MGVGGFVYGVGEVSLTKGDIHVLDGVPVMPVSSRLEQRPDPKRQEPGVWRLPVCAPGS